MDEIEQNDEVKPLEIVVPGERYARIVGMLLGNRRPITFYTQGGAVYALDGKQYHVTGSEIEIWDHFDFMTAIKRDMFPRHWIPQ